MPKVKLTIPPGPWTKTSNYLIDVLLPKLKDTELRILLVANRRSTGFQREGREITLTYRMLEKLTGRRSEALALALHDLERRGLIHKYKPERTKTLRKGNNSPSQSEGQHINKER